MSQKEAEKNGKNKVLASPGRKEPGLGGNHKSDIGGSLTKLKPYGGAFLWAALTFLVTLALFFVSLVPPQVDLKLGQVSPIDVKATKEVIDFAATEQLRNERAAGVSEVYDSNPKVLEDTRTLFQELSQKIRLLGEEEEISTQEIVEELRPYVGEAVPEIDIIGVVAASPSVVDKSISVAGEIVEEILLRGLKPENVEKGIEEALNKIAVDKSIPEQVARILSAFVQRNLNPNLTLNKEETDKKIRQAIVSVEPVKIRRDEFIVRKGDVVTENQVSILQQLGIMGTRVRFSQISGAFLIALLFCGFTGVYIATYYPEILSGTNTALLASVIILSVGIIKALSGVSGFLAPVAFGVMLSSTLIDRRFGAFFGSGLTLAVGVMTGFEVKFVALALTSGLAAALSVRRVWNRSQLFKASIVVMVVSGITYACLALTGAMALDDVSVWREIVLVLANGPLSAVLAVGSLPLFETVFGIITPIRLIELSNPEHPLLHRLLLEAPGTYHHSIMVGNLAEAAAWGIGANSLLTRVGAYYHDIGKIKRPYMFAENQVFGMENPHEKMSPSLSATVILSHVKDGVELAKAHKVPEIIQDFIREHHGTALASFFYAKASESAAARDGRIPDEWSFRYEGPRPGSKETAIVMLADGIEAATRSLSKPNPARIESVVRKMIQDRLFDHQLDRSDLTMKELDTIAETFIKVLAGIFHTRIEYPALKEKDGGDGGQ